MNKKTSILVVDDDPDISRFFSKILIKDGYEVFVAETGLSGLQLVHEKRPDIVLLDVMLPDANGIDICQQIKSTPVLADVFVVLCSGTATSIPDKYSGHSAGADEFIGKPVQWDEFRIRLRTIARLQQTTAALRASEQHYRQLVEILPEAVGLMHPDGRLYSVNPQTVKMLSCESEASLLGKSIFELVAPEDHAAMGEGMVIALQQGIFRNMEFTMLRNGSRFPVEVSMAALDTRQDHPSGLVVAVHDISQRKQAAEQIQKLLNLLDQAHDAIWIHDLDGKIHYFNKGAERLLHWTMEEVNGGYARDFFFEDASQFHTAQAALQNADEWDGEVALVTKARQQVIVYSRWTSVLAGGQKAPQRVVINTDITRRKITEALLRERELVSQTIISSAMDGFWLVDVNGVLLDANDAYSQMSGYSRTELLGKHISELDVNDSTAAKVNQRIQRLVEGGADRFESRHRRKDGQVFDVEVSNMIIKFRGQCICSFLRDISERKRSQHRLMDLLELNQTILATSSVGILAYGVSGKCIFANAASARIMQTPVAQLLEENFLILPHWKQSGLLELAKEETLRTRKVHTGEVYAVTPGGKELWFDYHMASFINTGERHLLFVFNEITERKQAEETLRQWPQRLLEAQEGERQRVARELHDGVNQMIASAKMRLRKVEATVAGVSPAAREILLRSEDLLSQALEENRRIAHNLRPSDLDHFGLVIACRNFCERFQARTDVVVKLNITEFKERLSPEAELNLFRILQEALNNIEKHAQAKTVKVQLGLKHNIILLKIQDDGKGFDIQQANERAGKTHGVGLKNICERATFLGATYDIKSAPGDGTTISVHTPWQNLT